MMKLSEKAAYMYLSQTLLLNERIDHNVEHSHALRRLMSGVADDSHSKEIAREMIDLEARIVDDVDALVDLKRDIARHIKRMADVKLQLVLEFRYLCGRTWEQVAGDMGLSVAHVRRLHRIALTQFPRTVDGGG